MMWDFRYSIIIGLVMCCVYGCVFAGSPRFNNVCPTLRDYKTIFHNKNCSFNPDVGSNTRMIAKRYGYAFEKHVVVTQDGYILNLHRIPGPKNTKTDRSNKKRPPIFIVHGVAGSAAFWMLQGKKSLAFFLADNGYDVWLGNLRGTYHSSGHTNQTTRTSDYWNFGIEDMAISDLPACIDFIANRTGEKGNLTYIGHSMGTTISYIYSILMKTHAQNNLKLIISLAPVAYMKNVMGAFKLLAPSAPLVTKILRSRGIHALGDNHSFQRTLLSLTCGKYPLIIPCNLILAFSSGFAVEEFQPEILPVFLSFYPSGVSLKTIQHFAQLIVSNGRFRMYDYGPKKNLKIYNSPTPLEYDVSQITVPVHLYVGTEDIVGDLKDAEILESKLNAGSTPIAKKFTFPYAHNDFFLGKHLNLFYDVLLESLNR